MHGGLGHLIKRCPSYSEANNHYGHAWPVPTPVVKVSSDREWIRTVPPYGPGQRYGGDISHHPLAVWRGRARDSAAGAEPTCILPRGQVKLRVERNPREAGGPREAPLGPWRVAKVSREGKALARLARLESLAFGLGDTPSGLESPRQASRGSVLSSIREVLSRRGPSRGKTLARLARLGEPGP